MRVFRMALGCAIMLASGRSCEELERQLDGALANRWGTNGKAIVISPEVDAWVWGSEPHLREVVDWQFDDGIRNWLRSRGYEFTGTDKPLVRKRRSRRSAGEPGCPDRPGFIATWRCG
jgi:hypothetical protein